MKRGQVQITFNWIYILIAGGLILLFFAGIIVRQQSLAEERLAGNVVNTLETIFTAAGVSEKTKNFLDTSGIADLTLEFTCEEGVGRYGLLEQGISVQDSVLPLFAPAQLQSQIGRAHV